MYSKITCILTTTMAVLLLITQCVAQTSPSSSIAAPVAGMATIRGKISDPSGALIPGTEITISNLKGQTVATAVADSAANFDIRTLPPGSYVVTATTSGFAPFISPTITLAAGQIKRIDIAMAIETAQQNIVVTDESPTVSVESDNNGNSMVIKGSDLDALSDDPDELSSELSALAGPSAGPNGGQIYIDGFSGGQLPPKSSIREIRVNQNPYSAEYDKLGFGRIEILTKPGTDKLHGQFMIQGNDSSFNTNSPFTKLPPYYSYQYNGTLNGSLGKNASFFIAAEHRNINNESVYTISCSTDGTCPVPTAGGFTTIASNGSVANPHIRTNVSPRLDLQLGGKNTLTIRYQFYKDEESGEIGATQVPSQSSKSTTTDNNVQLSDTIILNNHAVNETRFQYERTMDSTVPVSTLPTQQVNGSFTVGGSASQSSKSHSDQLELQNLTTLSLGRHAVKFGTRLRDYRNASYSNAGFNGTFIFNDVNDYLNAVTTSGPFTLQQVTYSAGSPKALANVFDAALFAQDDWKVNPRLTVSGGLRWESQNHVSDHSDWAPRFSFAWAVDGKGNKQAKTVLRGGYGIFYDRLGINNFLNINQSIEQSQFTLQSPDASCYTGTVNEGKNVAEACGGSETAKNISEVAPSYHSPYTQQFGASIERQITKTQTATVTYLHSQGVHQLVTINANAPYFPAGDQTDQYNIVNQYLPEGIFKQDQLIFNSNARISPRFNVFGFYTLSFAHSTGSAGSLASQSDNISHDYGPASFVARHQFFMVGNITGPWGIRFNPFLNAGAGRPYNITTRDDVNGDGYLNDRPGIVDASLCGTNATRYYSTQFGCLDASPASGEKIIGAYAGNGPANVALNMRISRSFGIGPKLAKTDPNANAGGPPGGGPPPGGGGRGGGPGGGGPGGGFGPGGFGGGGGRPPAGMFGGATSTRKYSLNFSAQVQNVFNNIAYGTPIGTLQDPKFGHSNSLQRGFFSQGSAPRRIYLQAVFSF